MSDELEAALIDDLRRTPGVRRAVRLKGRLCVEGSIPLTAMKRGRLEVSFRVALNRVRKEAKLKPLPFEQFEMDWYAMRPAEFEYRIYPVGGPTADWLERNGRPQPPTPAES